MVDSKQWIKTLVLELTVSSDRGAAAFVTDVFSLRSIVFDELWIEQVLIRLQNCFRCDGYSDDFKKTL